MKTEEDLNKMWGRAQNLCQTKGTLKQKFIMPPELREDHLLCMSHLLLLVDNTDSLRKRLKSISKDVAEIEKSSNPVHQELGKAMSELVNQWAEDTELTASTVKAAFACLARMVK